MKIISWNINGLRSAAESSFFQFLEEQRPDICCLQETKCHPAQADSAVLHPLEMQSYWSAAQRKGYSGVVTYSRQPLQTVNYGIGIRKFDREGRFVVSDHGPFKLYNVYFPNGGSGEERHLFKQEFLQRFLFELKLDLAHNRSVIVLGDYNVAPQPMDVYDSVKLARESGFLPEERRWFAEFLEAGFLDSYRVFHPDQKDAYTWWSMVEGARISNRGWRIDHICVSKDLKPRLRRCEILDGQMGSDHCPILLELEA